MLSVLIFAAFLLLSTNRGNCQQPLSSESAVIKPTATIALNGTRNKEQLRTAKSFARMSFKKYLQRKVLEKTREMAIELKEWTFDENKERYTIEYEVSFEILKDDFYGDEWITLKRTFVLSCDVDGRNASLKNTEEKLNYVFENISN